MKILSVALLAAAIASDAHRIYSVENTGNWVYMYDDKGKKYKSLSASSVGEVMGFSSTFFVSHNGNWVYLFDSEGKKYKSLSFRAMHKQAPHERAAFVFLIFTLRIDANRHGAVVDKGDFHICAKLSGAYGPADCSRKGAAEPFIQGNSQFVTSSTDV